MTDDDSLIKYIVPDDATVKLNGVEVTTTALVANQYVFLKLVNSVVTEVYATSGSYSLTGVIDSVKYGTSVSIKLKDADGIMYCYEVVIANLPEITRGDTEISIDG
jgi:hypothetical protein